MFGVRVKAEKARTAAGQDIEDIKQEALVLADDALAAFRVKGGCLSDSLTHSKALRCTRGA